MHLLLGHYPFGLVVILLILVLALFIYLAVKTYSRHDKQGRKYGLLFSIGSGLVFLLLAIVVIQHYLIHK